MNPCHGPNCTKLAKNIFCSRRCCCRSNVKREQTTYVKDTKAPTPEKTSWWCDYARFYTEARERFPADAGDKSHAPVQTYGRYGPDLLVMGKARERERRRERAAS